MHDLDEKIREFGTLFYGRLDAELLKDAISYINHNERGLAFETICDHISEYDVKITEEEYLLAISICNDLQMDVNDISLIDMKNLIIK